MSKAPGEGWSSSCPSGPGRCSGTEVSRAQSPLLEHGGHRPGRRPYLFSKWLCHLSKPREPGSSHHASEIEDGVNELARSENSLPKRGYWKNWKITPNFSLMPCKAIASFKSQSPVSPPQVLSPHPGPAPLPQSSHPDARPAPGLLS